MAMIYYTGNADYDPDTDPLAVVIRATDEAGNILVSIRAGERMSGGTFELRYGYQPLWGGYVGYTSRGVPIARVGVITHYNAPSSWRPWCCAVRSDGWIFAPSAPYTVDSVIDDGAGGYTTGEFWFDFIRVYRRNGDRVPFPQLHGARICAVALDADDNILVGGDEAGTERYHLRKYDPDGNLIWSVAGPALDAPVGQLTGDRYQLIEHILVGDDGYIYVAGNEYIRGLQYYTYHFVKKYDSDGIEQWSVPAVNSPYSFTSIVNLIQFDGALYTCGSEYDAALGNYTDVRKLSMADGSTLARHAGTDSYTITADGAQIIGVRFTNVNATWDRRTFDPDDLSVLSEDFPNWSLSPARGNNIAATAAGTVYHSDHNKPDALADRTHVQIVETTQTPAIQLPLSLAAFSWIGDTYTSPPGLPLRLGVSVPGFRREYAGALPLPDVYRATLSGTPDLSVPLSSISLRRDAAGAALTLVSPGADPDQIAGLIARSEGTLILWRGVRFPDGLEQIEPMLEVQLATLRYDIGARSGSVTLAGSLDEAPGAAKTRRLRGISYRSESNGLRRVRCAIDSYLAPGDTADLGGGETLTVAEIVYAIDATDATMEVAE
jgi:hypothetical protein